MGNALGKPNLRRAQLGGRSLERTRRGNFALELHGHLAADINQAMQEIIGGGVRRWCQANANQSPKSAATPSLCRQLTPLGQRGGAVLLEVGAAFKMSVGIEMVEGRSMNGGEFL